MRAYFRPGSGTISPRIYVEKVLHVGYGIKVIDPEIKWTLDSLCVREIFSLEDDNWKGWILPFYFSQEYFSKFPFDFSQGSDWMKG